MAEKERPNIFESIRPTKPFPAQRDAKKGYFDLFHEDSEIAVQSREVFSESIAVFDEMMIFAYELIIVVYRNVEIWKDDQQRRFVHAAISASFNTLVLARTTVLSGYFFDIQLIIRSAQEWLVRAFLFHEDRDSVTEFIDKGQIQDRYVRDRLKLIIEEKQTGLGADIARMFRRLYGRRSNLGHATFQALAIRTFSRAFSAGNRPQRRELAKTLGTGTIVGGYMTREVGYAAFIDLITQIEALLQISVAQIPGDNPDIKERYGELRNIAIRQIENLKAELIDAYRNSSDGDR